ncbi:MAG: hypothetical protein GY756_14395 [bacterium]|nr:hypothetical protein [bacterium]
MGGRTNIGLHHTAVLDSVVSIGDSVYPASVKAIQFSAKNIKLSGILEQATNEYKGYSGKLEISGELEISKEEAGFISRRFNGKPTLQQQKRNNQRLKRRVKEKFQSSDEILAEHLHFFRRAV